jgi:hypothetical protein
VHAKYLEANREIAARIEIERGTLSTALAAAAGDWEFYPEKVDGKPPRCLAQVATVTLPLKPKGSGGAPQTIDLKSDKGGVLRFKYPSSGPLTITIGNATEDDIKFVSKMTQGIDKHFLLHYKLLGTEPGVPPAPIHVGDCKQKTALKVIGGDNCPYAVFRRPRTGAGSQP